MKISCLVIALLVLALPYIAVAQDDGGLSRTAQDYIEAFNTSNVDEMARFLTENTDRAKLSENRLRAWAEAHIPLMEARAPFGPATSLSIAPASEEFLARSIANGYWYRWGLNYHDDGTVSSTWLRRSFSPEGWDPATYMKPDLTAVAEALRTHLGAPAVALVVVRSEGNPVVGVAGVRRLDAEGSVQPSDRFHIGSCTKAMTATIVASLVSEGVLEWTSTIDQLMGDSPVHPDLQSVTIDDLLRHRAGLGRNWYTERGFKSFANVDALYNDFSGSRSELYADIAKKMLAHRPVHRRGTTTYSSVGYTVLAHLIERASGQPWEKLLHERVFEPAGMTTAGLGWPATDDPEGQPWGHAADDDWRLTPEAPDAYGSPYALGPGGDVHCSIADLARFMQFHLRGLKGEIDDPSQESFHRLHSPDPGDVESQGYAAGWQVDLINGFRVHAHSGSANRFYTKMEIVPGQDFAIAMAINTQAPASEWHVLMNRIMRVTAAVARRELMRAAPSTDQDP